MKHPTWAAFRDTVLLVGGLALLTHESLIVPEPRIVLITIASAMIGLPATLRLDQVVRTLSGPSDKPTPPAPLTPPSQTPSPDSSDGTP
jgi:hypothetical protein